MINKEHIIKSALAHNICSEGLERLTNGRNMGELMELYIDGLDFCLSEDFPSLNYMRENVKGMTEAYGVFVDGDYSSTNKKLTVLLGNSTAQLSFDGYSVGEVYVKHTGNVTVKATDNAVVRIDCFDISHVKINASGSAKVFINMYGNAAVNHNAIEGARVKVTEKGRKSY